MKTVRSNEPIPVSTTTAASVALPALARGRVLDFLELTKPRISALVLITTVVGFVLAAGDATGELVGLFHAVVGTALAAAGANALNQLLEREHDARMVRTAGRPLPTGRLGPGDVLVFGLVCAVAGVAYLAVMNNALCAAVGAATLLSYVALYTPLKRLTPWCTVVGALPGALPPVIGWTAARNSLDLGALLLFAIVFVWQIPHFWAIAWLYRGDYRRAGFPMLPVIDRDGRRTGRQVVALSLLLLAISAGPWWFGLAGGWYLAGAVLLGMAFVGCGAGFALAKTHASARRLMIGSIAYLPLLLGLLIIDG